MDALPWPRPVTRPVEETLAIDVLLDDQVMVRSERVFPLASCVVAENSAV